MYKRKIKIKRKITRKIKDKNVGYELMTMLVKS